jgi:hypothetical protein
MKRSPTKSRLPARRDRLRDRLRDRRFNAQRKAAVQSIEIGPKPLNLPHPRQAA